MGERIQGTFIGTLVQRARMVGLTPWVVVPQFERLRERLLQGGAMEVVKVGPKTAPSTCVSSSSATSATFAPLSAAFFLGGEARRRQVGHRACRERPWLRSALRVSLFMGVALLARACEVEASIPSIEYKTRPGRPLLRIENRWRTNHSRRVSCTS